MSDIEQETKFDDHENRIKRLENDENVNNILKIVQKIESRLIGGLDNETPGLIPEFKQLKKDFEDLKLQVKEILPAKNAISDVKDLQKDIKALMTHKYILYISGMILFYLLGHPEIVKSLLGIK